MNNTTRTTNYVCTLNLTSPVDKTVLEVIRKTASLANASFKDFSGKKLRVTVNPRMGKNNPLAKYYKHKKRVHLEDAQRVDVYVHSYYPSTTTKYSVAL